MCCRTQVGWQKFRVADVAGYLLLQLPGFCRGRVIAGDRRIQCRRIPKPGSDSWSAGEERNASVQIRQWICSCVPQLFQVEPGPGSRVPGVRFCEGGTLHNHAQVIPGRCDFTIDQAFAYVHRQLRRNEPEDFDRQLANITPAPRSRSAGRDSLARQVEIDRGGQMHGT